MLACAPTGPPHAQVLARGSRRGDLNRVPNHSVLPTFPHIARPWGSPMASSDRHAGTWPSRCGSGQAKRRCSTSSHAVVAHRRHPLPPWGPWVGFWTRRACPPSRTSRSTRPDLEPCLKRHVGKWRRGRASWFYCQAGRARRLTRSAMLGRVHHDLTAMAVR